jgi:hypothetical protein
MHLSRGDVEIDAAQNLIIAGFGSKSLYVQHLFT